MNQGFAGEPLRPVHRWWAWLVPSVGQWLWLTLLLLLLTQAWRTTMVAGDGDACMHWRVGESMLQSRHVIRTDVFSHTRYGAPVITKEWLAEILFAVAGRAGGLYGLAVVAALAIATTFALLHRQLLREGNDLLVATLLALLAAWASNNHWLARPHTFSFLMMLLWHDALRRYERGGRALALALALGLITLLWVNLHGGYLAGFLVLGAYWLGSAIDWVRAGDADRLAARRRFAALSVVALLCLVVSLVNPNGYAVHLHNLRFLQSRFFKNWLNEYQTINFQKPMAYGFLAWLAVTFFTLARCRPQVSVGAALVLISWTYFALYSSRNIALLAILSAPILAPALSAGLSEAHQRWREFSQRLTDINRLSRGWPVVATAAFIAVVLVPRPTAMPANLYPVDAVAFVKHNPELFQGPMFNQYAWGGYLMLGLPEHKTFVDGRTDFFGEELIREFDDTTALRPNWKDALDKYHVTWTLMPADHRLNLAVALLPGWTLVRSNEVFAIYRQGP